MSFSEVSEGQVNAPPPADPTAGLPYGVPAPPPPGYYPYGAPIQKPPANGLAIASMVLGIIWLWGLGSILAIIFGYVAKRQIKQSNGTQGGSGMATAGIVLGWVGTCAVVGMFLLIAIVAALGGKVTDNPRQDAAAQSSLRNALTAAKTAYIDQQSYATSTATDLPTIEPSLTYVAADTASADTTVDGATVPSFEVVSVNVESPDNQVWSAAVLSKSGTCFWIKDIAYGSGVSTFYGSGATCTGTAALGAASASW